MSLRVTIISWYLLSLWYTIIYCSPHGEKETEHEAANNMTVIQWYRTAQGTKDQLTRQPDVQFGPDFSSDAVIYINRY